MNNYKLLPGLNALLQTQSLTEAAKLLNVTQPAMSRTLNQIRVAFNDPILVRDGKEFYLTHRAKQLKVLLPSLLLEIDTLYEQTEFNIQESQRSFHIAFDAFISDKSLPNIVGTLTDTSPKVSITGSILQPGSLESLADSELDLVATMALDIPNELHGKAIATDRYVVLYSPSHWQDLGDITDKRYFKAKHVQVIGLADKVREVDRAFYKQNKKRQVVARVPSFECGAKILEASNFLMTVPLHIALLLCGQYKLAWCDIPFELPDHQYYLLWHQKHHKDPEHQWFRDVCFNAISAYLNVDG